MKAVDKFEYKKVINSQLMQHGGLDKQFLEQLRIKLELLEFLFI